MFEWGVPILVDLRKGMGGSATRTQGGGVREAQTVGDVLDEVFPFWNEASSSKGNLALTFS